MTIKELRVDLPLSVSVSEAKLLLAINLFEVRKASLGQAAKIAELSKRAFMEIIDIYGVQIFCYSPEELSHEVDS